MATPKKSEKIKNEIINDGKSEVNEFNNEITEEFNEIDNQKKLIKTENLAEIESENTDKINEELDFEENMTKLEQIVKKLESGGLELKKMIELFESGVNLTKTCNKILDEAEQKVEILVNNNDKQQ